MTNIIQKSPPTEGSIRPASKETQLILWTPRFITFFTTVRHLSLSSTRSIQSPLSQLIYLRKKVKVKVHPRRAHEGPEKEQSYSSTLSLTSALGGGGWTARGPGLFVPRKVTRYPLYRTLGRPQGWSGRVGKILPLP